MRKAEVTNVKSELVITTRRVLANPTKKDRGETMIERLARKRKHRREWPVPEDATLILSLHFDVQSYKRSQHHASATLEIPCKGGTDSFCIGRGAATRHGALLKVIQEIENSLWFHEFRRQGVRFRITGCEMEALYRGYL